MSEPSQELSPEQLAELKELLLQQLATTKESLELSQKNSQPVQLDPAVFGRLSRMDAIQQQKMAEASARSNKLLLKQTEAALKAIENHEYGECKSCGEYISYKRLRARPESLICVECKKRIE